MKSLAFAAAIGAAVLLSGCIPTQIDANNASPSPTDAALAVPTPSVAPTTTGAPASTATNAPAGTATATTAPATTAPTAQPTPPPTPRPTPVPTPVPTPQPTATPAPTPTPTPTAVPTCGATSTANPPVAPASTLGFYGKVTDQCTGKPLANVCITVGVPGAFCWGKTDVNGNYQIDLAAVSASPGQFELYFILQPYAVDHSVKQQVNGVVRIDFQMHP